MNDSFHSPRQGQRDFNRLVACPDDQPVLAHQPGRRIRPVRLAPPWQWTTTVRPSARQASIVETQSSTTNASAGL